MRLSLTPSAAHVSLARLSRRRRRLSRAEVALALAALAALVAVPQLSAQRPVLSPQARQFVVRDTALLALTNVRVIDGSGSPARDAQTVIVRDGRIAAVGPAATTPVPAGAQVLDLPGRTVIPGLVMVHEHLYYPVGPGVYGNLTESFVRLYLAGGVTSMRTGGNMNGYGELNIKRAIDRGDKAGPWIDATAPYVNGPNPFGQMQALNTAAEARRFVDFWADQGATSFKGYMQVSRDVLGAAIQQAHARGLKVTGHLCSVTYREATALGIDNLEHGFLAATDFVADKAPDSCPGQGKGQQSVNAMEVTNPAFTALVAELVQRNVAVTSTLTVFETFAPGRPIPPGVDVLLPELRDAYLRQHATVSRNAQSIYTTLLPKAMAMELAFARAGGLLVAGTDPTGGGGVIAGYSNQRALELLVEAGFSPVEAIRIGTLNGATYLGRDQLVGSIAPGKQADLVVIGGDPSTRIADVRNVELVFKQGVGYDPQKLVNSVKGKVGLY
ncbi:MAG: amidohydrolase family protein [Gemmatimonadetes bacterium]|nr:amidohydrolase family protein [Gemmatimonadota bacterium]